MRRCFSEVLEALRGPGGPGWATRMDRGLSFLRQEQELLQNLEKRRDLEQRPRVRSTPLRRGDV